MGGKKLMTNYAVCKNCSKYIQFNHSATNQLSRHKCNNGNTQTTISLFTDNGSSSSSIRNRFLPVKVTREDIMKVRDGVSKFVALDIRPFSAVEGDGLKEMIKSVVEGCNKYENLNDSDVDRLLPSHQTVARHIDVTHLNAKAIMKTDFQKALKFPGGFSCTADEYTDQYKSNVYLGITASLNLIENDKIQRKSYIVHLNKISGKAGEVIFDAVLKCFAELGVNEDQVVNNIVWVTDRGPNITKAFRIKNATRLNCYAHLINNIVRHMCNDEPQMKKIIDDSSTLVRYMKTSTIDCS